VHVGAPRPRLALLCGRQFNNNSMPMMNSLADGLSQCEESGK
jgi:hypothetical protein